MGCKIFNRGLTLTTQIIAVLLFFPLSASILAQTQQPQNRPSSASPTTPPTSQPQNAAPEKSPPITTPEYPDPVEQTRQQMLQAADALYLDGKKEEAASLYRKAKGDPSTSEAQTTISQPIVDPAALPPGGRVYWREAQAGLAQQLQTRTIVPLQLLVEQYPTFIPGYLRLAEVLNQYQRSQEALAVLEKAVNRYPNQPDLMKVLVRQQAALYHWFDASVMARQFSLLYPENPQSAEFSQMADLYAKRFRSSIRAKMTGNVISGVLSGAAGIVLTGSPFMAIPSIENAILMLRGEESVGNSAVKAVKKRFPLIEDPQVQAYVDRIGQKLAAVTGRKFTYEFYVVSDPELNAFSVPGGKVFINGGAIVKSRSEAELAGLIAHELSHTVLSHNFQLATGANTTASFTLLIPYGGSTIARLAIARYSRDMERQADLLGTRLIATSGYAADGLLNLMNTLSKEKEQPLWPWISTHPASKDRIQYLESLIDQNGYNRYAYEGIAEHVKVQTLVQSRLKTLDKETRKTTHNP